MSITINTIHFQPDNKLHIFVKKKINKILKIDKRIIAADVFLKLSKAASFSNKIAEIKLKYPGSEFFAKRQSDTFEESVAKVLQALRKQILKNKKRK